jgi:hypothetical protein
MTVIFVSCEKDENDLTTSSNENTEMRIQDFKASILKKSTTGDNMPLDSLVWYAEAAFNYSYGFPYLDYAEVITDSTLIEIEVEDGCEVTYAEVIESYNEMDNFIATVYNNYDAKNKHVVSVDLVTESCDETTAYVWLYVKVGEFYVYDDEGQFKSTFNPFTIFDSWPAYLEGYLNCGPNSFPGLTTERLEVYMKYYNSNLNYLVAPRVYFTDIVSDQIISAYEVPNNDPITQIEYPFFLYESDYWDRVCLSPEDMYFMLQHMDYVLLDFMAAPYSGKLPHNVDIHTEFATKKGRELAAYFINADMGVKHVRTINPADPVLTEN